MCATCRGDRMAIGILDSGVGGLSILREVRAQLPAEDIVYCADQAHVPYGPRTIDEVRAFTVGVARFLMSQGVRVVVVACNTASAAALHPLREMFPEMPFVGMEPAVKPAALATKTGVIGVIATEATFQSELFASVVGRFTQGVRVETRACPEFVRLAEAGDTDSPAAHLAVKNCLDPLIQAGIDQLVLGCTHFPFLTDAIKAFIGPGVTLVDPSVPVARQVGRVLAAQNLRRNGASAGHTTFYTSGDVGQFWAVSDRLLGVAAGGRDVRAVRWNAAGLETAEARG